jgi:hypothetical protein
MNSWAGVVGDQEVLLEAAHITLLDFLTLLPMAELEAFMEAVVEVLITSQDLTVLMVLFESFGVLDVLSHQPTQPTYNDIKESECLPLTYNLLTMYL